jgi:hypothetical protein
MHFLSSYSNRVTIRIPNNVEGMEVGIRLKILTLFFVIEPSPAGVLEELCLLGGSEFNGWTRVSHG